MVANTNMFGEGQSLGCVYIFISLYPSIHLPTYLPTPCRSRYLVSTWRMVCSWLGLDGSSDRLWGAIKLPNPPAADVERAQKPPPLRRCGRCQSSPLPTPPPKTVALFHLPSSDPAPLDKWQEASSSVATWTCQCGRQLIMGALGPGIGKRALQTQAPSTVSSLYGIFPPQSHPIAAVDFALSVVVGWVCVLRQWII